MGDKSEIKKILKILIYQIMLIPRLIKLKSEIDEYYFFFGSGLILFPTVFLKILGKKFGFILTGSYSKSSKCLYHGIKKIIYYSQHNIERINYHLADRLFVFSKTLIKDFNIEKFSYKIDSDSCPLFIDMDSFKPLNDFSKREKKIGFIGRLSSEKGVEPLLEAIDELSKDKSFDYTFCIVGDGPLRKKDEEYQSKRNNLECKGWVKQTEIPMLMNSFRFHILPSFTEAWGGAHLEAMCCGTIGIANSVGGIPDYSVDGFNSFLLKDNTKDGIVNTIKQVVRIEEDKLLEISHNARKWVEDNFTEEAAAKRWKRILHD